MWYQNIKHPERKKIKYKCPICKKEHIGKGYCYDCSMFKKEEIKTHEEELEKRRTYKHGNNILSIDEIFNQNLVYLGNKIMSIGFLISMPCQTVNNMIQGKCIYYAVKKEE
jgi:hypothetical protein